MKLTIEMTDTLAEKLLELGVIDLPEGARLGVTKEHQIAASMANVLCFKMSEKDIIKLNDFGGFTEPSFDEMTIKGSVFNLPDLELDM